MTVMETLKLGPEATLSCFMLFDFHVCCSLTCSVSLFLRHFGSYSVLAEITEEDKESHQLRGRSQRRCVGAACSQVQQRCSEGGVMAASPTVKLGFSLQIEA